MSATAASVHGPRHIVESIRRHRHRTRQNGRMHPWRSELEGVVTLPDSRRLRGRGLRDALAPQQDAPGFGLYLTARQHEEPGWESRWVSWPDFRLPRSPQEAIDALLDAYERSADTRVEIACGGGTGRTGTAIAILARYAGVPAHDAVAWTRANYRPGAVETPWQRRFVRRIDLAASRGSKPTS